MTILIITPFMFVLWYCTPACSETKFHQLLIHNHFSLVSFFQLFTFFFHSHQHKQLNYSLQFNLPAARIPYNACIRERNIISGISGGGKKKKKKRKVAVVVFRDLFHRITE